MEIRQYTIDQLSELTGYKRRTIRYYIQQGILQPPAGRGRGGFYYDSHLKQLRDIRAQQDKGLGLAEIIPLLKTDLSGETTPARVIRARYEIVPGLEIDVSRTLEEQQGKKINRLLKIARSIMMEENASD
ncbi:MAG: MerR family transcriptional regulator [Chloroflexi bacterium]|nr:MerR family transcriptional regulator [Chloroflexota bacterium]